MHGRISWNSVAATAYGSTDLCDHLDLYGISGPNRVCAIMAYQNGIVAPTDAQ